ncbi:MAG TPA: rhomboid family intramembrane serine protease [Anaeromyxobacter sp.]|nr:rhomboid family intramembrane serine protease [Anaeromyxobacter sp.]
MARRRDYTSFFTFGGRVPASVGFFLVLMLVSSVAASVDRRVVDFTALAPFYVKRGELWRLVTWPFVQGDVLALLFVGFMVWTLGQQLSYAWSERRFVTRFFGYTLGAAVGTTLLSFVFDSANEPHYGAWPVVNALIVAWAMLFPDRQVNIWGVLPVTGRTVALLVLGGTVLAAVMTGKLHGFGGFTPHLVAIAIAWVQARGAGGRRLGWQARQWWADREMRRRTKHLKVVRKDGSGDRPRWMN